MGAYAKAMVATPHQIQAPSHASTQTGTVSFQPIVEMQFCLENSYSQLRGLIGCQEESRWRKIETVLLGEYQHCAHD
jgi:hypothetical protein